MAEKDATVRLRRAVKGSSFYQYQSVVLNNAHIYREQSLPRQEAHSTNRHAES
jgi:hypothetical protein